ncbi:MAG: hypothetical protein WCJ61_07615 [Paludibacter sp.]
MKNLILLFLFAVLISCSSRKIEGIYCYEEKEVKGGLFDVGGAAERGSDIACSMIGQFEFKNGKCYLNIMGVEQRLDYEVEDSMIFLGSNSLNSAGIGLRIIDENTLLYGGGIFKKRGEKNKVEDGNQSTKKKPISAISGIDNKSNNINTNETEHIEKTSNPHDALIKDIFTKDGVIYLVLDYVQLIDDYGSYKNNTQKLRTFKLSDNCKIQNCITDTELTIENIFTHKNEFISTLNKEHLIICYIEDDNITSLNIGCWG